MNSISLSQKHFTDILFLEEKMYWQSGSWQRLWKKEAKEKFKVFNSDYISNYPQGCLGLADDSGQLLGAIFLIKTSKPEPIPYLHKVSECLEEDGKIAYVSLFVVKKGKKEGEIAQKLYNEAEEVALLKLRCKTMAVVIYLSPLEEKILKGNNYEKINKQFEWEIYPGKKVPCWIYSYELLMRQEERR